MKLYRQTTSASLNVSQGNPPKEFEQGTVQSSTGGTAMVAGPVPEDSRMRV